MKCTHADSTPGYEPNGCGPGPDTLLNRFLNWIIPDNLFHEECNCHDRAYQYGACRILDPDARYKADRELELACIERANKLPRWRRPFARKLAHAFGDAVTLAGDHRFNWFNTPKEWLEHLERNNYVVPDELPAIVKARAMEQQGAHRRPIP